jgi:hypothetical protein
MTLQGKWRIVQAELWDKSYLDLVEPAFIAIDDRGIGEMVYGVLNATLHCAYTQSGFDFIWDGSDEGETSFKALPWTGSSTPC